MNSPLKPIPCVDHSTQNLVKRQHENNLEAVQQAKNNGLFRLLRSLLRENIFQWQVIKRGKGNGDKAGHSEKIDLGDIEEVVLLEGNGIYFWITEPRYDYFGGLSGFTTCYCQNKKALELITDPVSALEKILIITDSDADPAWQRIKQELKNSTENETLTIDWRQQQDLKIKQTCLTQQFNNMLQWSRFRANEDSTKSIGNSAIVLEQWAATGHPYHPGSKTKLGLSAEEVWRYAPEFSPQVPLVLIAVEQSLMSVQTLCTGMNYKRWFSSQYPQWYQQWQAHFKAEDIDGFLPLPVHPWQLEHELPDRFSAEISQGKILLTGPEFSSAPTLSFRTMAPGYDRQQPYIKLPVAAQMTSSMRNLSASSVDNAPIIASILQDILTSRTDIASVLRCQWDEVGVHGNMDNAERDDDRYLSVIFRRNPARLLSENEHAVVIAALFTSTPTSDEPLLIELMTMSGVESHAQALAWFAHYTETLLLAVLDLFLDYGLALEAHQQNMMAIFTDQGQLTGFINRDVGGICIHQPTLEQSGWSVNFSPAATLVASMDEARVNFSHAVLQSHLGEIIKLLHNRYQLSAQQLWQQVGLTLHKGLLAYRDKQGEQAYQRELQAFLFDPWPGTAFIRMRLQDQSQHAENQPIVNPLEKAMPLEKAVSLEQTVLLSRAELVAEPVSSLNIGVNA